jgi:hypothetical protein
MPNDYPVMREVIGLLDGWIQIFAGTLGPPLPLQIKKGPLEGLFWWQFREKNERGLLVAKAVRCVSGIRAELLLVENGYIEECGSLLRAVSDFTYEILSISDAIATGNWTKEQLKFVEQYFAELSQTPEEYANTKRERWVTRDELLKAHYKRFAESANTDPEHLRKVVRYLSYGLDKFVHGAYVTAMELYDGATQQFMLSGCTYPEKLDEFKFSLASKFHEFLGSLASMAMAFNMRALAQEIAVNDQRFVKAELAN